MQISESKREPSFHCPAKIELAELALEVQGRPFKFCYTATLFFYMYGGIIYKYVLGSRALAEALSYNITGSHLRYK